MSSLYRLDDFVREDLGNGFFSDVYKVSSLILCFSVGLTVWCFLGRYADFGGS